VRRLETPFGQFTLLEIKIDTGRTHQIRVHMASLGHPIVGDKLYGAPRELRGLPRSGDANGAASLSRNFLHAAKLELAHPRTGQKIALETALPEELEGFLNMLEASRGQARSGRRH
ncbi:MAG TPA: hypothetical protein VEJ00_06115, partial [Candidatus Acidoferrales bacterium]|nr:hypothetical protein [Candidatus Acidoferrales bacterium]